MNDPRHGFMSRLRHVVYKCVCTQIVEVSLFRVALHQTDLSWVGPEKGPSNTHRGTSKHQKKTAHFAVHPVITDIKYKWLVLH